MIAVGEGWGRKDPNHSSMAEWLDYGAMNYMTQHQALAV
jgi:hypothetical protein